MDEFTKRYYKYKIRIKTFFFRCVNSIAPFYKKYKEIILYLIFGVLTTLVALITYFGIINFGKYILDINPDTGKFYWVRSAAQILQWVFAVIFAFFTNRKWVFNGAETGGKSAFGQFWMFCGSRLATLGFDTVITFSTVWILDSCKYKGTEFDIFGHTITLNSDGVAKILSSVVVVILNYFLSKLVVFRNEDGKPVSPDEASGTEPEVTIGIRKK